MNRLITEPLGVEVNQLGPLYVARDKSLRRLLWCGYA
jgi:hypothetical protein